MLKVHLAGPSAQDCKFVPPILRLRSQPDSLRNECQFAVLRPTQVYSNKEPYERAADGQAYQTGFHCQLDVVKTPAVRAIFPLLLKPLRVLPFAPDEPGFDAASPCGYGGVLLLDNVSATTANQGRELLDALREWCCDNQVISAHVRLHPAFKQEDWFASIIGEGSQLHRAGPTVAIDVRPLPHKDRKYCDSGQGTEVRP
jgi:hypothetical protein